MWQKKILRHRCLNGVASANIAIRYRLDPYMFTGSKRIRIQWTKLGVSGFPKIRLTYHTSCSPALVPVLRALLAEILPQFVSSCASLWGHLLLHQLVSSSPPEFEELHNQSNISYRCRYRSSGLWIRIRMNFHSWIRIQEVPVPVIVWYKKAEKMAGNWWSF